MPGVRVSTAVRTGPVGTTDIIAGQLFVIGRTERGPVDSITLLRSFSEYTTYYGKYKSDNLYAHVKNFFDEGGSRCYIQRVVGTGSATATLTVNDSATPTPLATMTFTAANPGTWANGAAGGLKVQVVAPDSSGFRIKIFLNDELILTTRDLVDVADAVTVINSSSVSHLIVASDNTASSANPAVMGSASSLASGTDVAVDDALIAAQLASETTLMNGTYNTGCVAAPGFYGSTVWNALRDHATALNRIAICSFDPSASVATIKSSAAAYYGDDSASFMGFYWPSIKVDAPSSTELANGVGVISSSTVTIAPDTYVAAARSRAVQEAGGPWRAGAGQISAARSIRDLAQNVTPASADLLDQARINVIRKIGGSIRVYGARSVSNDEANWRYITMRDTLNYISVGIDERMERYVFETIDGRGGLFGRIRGSIKAFLEPIRVAGGLYEAYDDTGALIDPGYSVSVDNLSNPASQLATGLVKAQVGVRVSGVADLIEIVITKSNLSAPII